MSCLFIISPLRWRQQGRKHSWNVIDNLVAELGVAPPACDYGENRLPILKLATEQRARSPRPLTIYDSFYGVTSPVRLALNFRQLDATCNTYEFTALQM